VLTSNSPIGTCSRRLRSVSTLSEVAAFTKSELQV
jgi:hypothetical protein